MFVWDAASQSTKLLDTLKIWQVIAPALTGYAYGWT